MGQWIDGAVGAMTQGERDDDGAQQPALASSNSAPLKAHGAMGGETV
ncbi:hypothetical protein [Streptomyces chartreusis]